MQLIKRYLAPLIEYELKRTSLSSLSSHPLPKQMMGES